MAKTHRPARTWQWQACSVDWRWPTRVLVQYMDLQDQLAASFPAPHGAVCAALLPHVMTANLRALREREPRSFALSRYYRVAGFLTGNPNATAEAGVEWVRQLVADVQIPKLGTYGIKSEHIDELVEKAMQASSMKANPIVLTREELADTLRRAL